MEINGILYKPSKFLQNKYRHHNKCCDACMSIYLVLPHFEQYVTDTY